MLEESIREEGGVQLCQQLRRPRFEIMVNHQHVQKNVEFSAFKVTLEDRQLQINKVLLNPQSLVIALWIRTPWSKSQNGEFSPYPEMLLVPRMSQYGFLVASRYGAKAPKVPIQ
ncbi:hypothetical protein T265_07540 [Opisthorchis viverrini]|uniref:Uncharacterized protein n=1 Tax=Opisthorchis viverrini TaxID=6198 RepID=A0A074ZCM6_OPIVI|nr:hypothetical protein T265_07540 [Opisthorchis viverrini]KER24918.1 hypothetical protein T265_07540 [Opisthorchis viverrini]